MNTVTAHCIKTLVKAGKIEQAVKIAVMQSLQPHEQGLFVYEARRTAEDAGMTAAQFAGGLSALTEKGIYTPSQDPEFRGKYGYFKDL